MTIDSLGQTLTAAQRMLYAQTPDGAFFENFAKAYADCRSSAMPDGNAAPSGALADAFGLTFRECSARRGISGADQMAYAAILARAYSKAGMADPARFLASLGPEELAVVQRVHGLAGRIDPGGLSREGAYNLLLPDGYRVDLNHDGIEEVGAGRTMQFPPADAPASVKRAWFDATRNMSAGDVLGYGLTMHDIIYGITIDGRPNGGIGPSDRVESYREGVTRQLQMLERMQGQLPGDQYARDTAFFSRLLRALSTASATAVQGGAFAGN